MSNSIDKQNLKKEPTNAIGSSFCIDCGKEVSTKYTKRCGSCNIIYFHKIGIINNKGENNGNFKGGIPDCSCCGKQLSGREHNKCNSCSQKGKKLSKCTKNKMSLSKLNRKVSSETRIKMSRTRIKKGLSKGRLNPRFGKLPIIKNHWIKYKKIWMRSSWEMKYAQYLDRHEIEWLYEDKTFDLGNTTYTPDFYLPETNEYIEIKGYWREKAKNNIRLFKKLYHKENLVILEENDLKKLGVL